MNKILIEQLRERARILSKKISKNPKLAYLKELSDVNRLLNKISL